MYKILSNVLNDPKPPSPTTCDDEFLAVAGSALFLHCDSTIVTSRVSRPGSVEFVRDRVLLGGEGIDEGIVPADLEGVVEVLGVVKDDDDLACDVHRRPAWNGCAG